MSPAAFNLNGAQRDALAFLADRERDVMELMAALIMAPRPNPPGDETGPAVVGERTSTACGALAPGQASRIFALTALAFGDNEPSGGGERKEVDATGR